MKFGRKSSKKSRKFTRCLFVQTQKPDFTIYTDGAADFSQCGVGGWAFVILDANGCCMKEGQGSQAAPTTANRMEVTALIHALQDCPSGNLLIHSDSLYLVKSIGKWMWGWQRNGWRKGRNSEDPGGELRNLDLWKQLFELLKDRSFKAEWIKGHSGNKWNEYCDERAEGVCDELRIENRLTLIS